MLYYCLKCRKNTENKSPNVEFKNLKKQEIRDIVIKMN